MDSAIPFKFNIPLIPLFAGTTFFVNCIVTFSLYAIQGRFNGYFPTISETAVGFFNTQYFQTAITVEAFFALISFQFIIFWGEKWELFPKWFVILGKILAYYMPLAMIGVGVCPFDLHLILHQFFADSLFGVFLLFNFITYILLYKKMSGTVFVERTVLLVISFISMIIMCLSLMIKEDGMQSMNGISEMIFVVAVISYILTWNQEFSSFKVEFFVDE